MKNIFKLLLFVLIAGTICCSSTGCGTNGKLTRRYAKVADSSLNNFGDKIQVFALIQPEPIVIPGKFIPKTIFDLSAEGQKALIQSINSNERNSDSLIAKLRKPLTVASPTKTNVFVDLTKFTRIFTLTSKQKVWNEADRIAQLDIALTGDNANLKFTGCDKIVTNYLTADFGKLTLTRTLSGEIGGSFGLNQTNTTSTQLVNGSTLNNTTSNGINNTTTTGNGATTSATTTNADGTSSNSQGSTNSIGSTNNGTASNGTSNTTTNTNTSGGGGQTAFTSGVTGKLAGSRSFYEEVGLRQRYINLSAYIDDKTLHFYQEGISGIDVSGNVIASVSFEFTGEITQSTAVRFSNLFNASNPAPLNTINSEHIVYSHPNLTKGITFKIAYDGVLRHVNKRARTISESDDKITRENGKVDSGGTLVMSKHEFMPLLWYIASVDANKKETTLEIEGPENSAERITGRLNFDSYDDAAEFLQWFKKSYTILAGSNFTFGVPERRYVLKASPVALTQAIAATMEVRILQ